MLILSNKTLSMAEHKSHTPFNELLESFDLKVPYAAESDSMEAYSITEYDKKYNRQDKSKKHKEHKKRSKKSKKSKHHSRCDSPGKYIESKENKLEEVKSEKHESKKRKRSRSSRNRSTTPKRHKQQKRCQPDDNNKQQTPNAIADQLKNDAPVNSGIGIDLLQKMECKPDEGLDKNPSGSSEPLLLEDKRDKRGIVTEAECQRNLTKGLSKKVASLNSSVEGKHCVSLLNEFCAKKKWCIPKFEVLDESGPCHKKTFIMTVNVNGQQYTSSRCVTKKLAKLEAAKACLKAIGVLK